jgi:predicted  nucleic acid-binding Zn-ribbon protein
MQCKNCGFLVPQEMKFALMQNFCPKCGNKLFSQQEKNDISMICTRIHSKPFSKNMSEELVHDIGLFVYGEIIGGYGQVILDRKVQSLNDKKSSETIASVPEEKISESVVIEVDKNSIDYKTKIREEEKARVLHRHEEVDDGSEEGDEEFSDWADQEEPDQDEKIRRLQELAKRVNISKNKPIKRLSD